MSFASALRAELINDATVSGIVGTRVHRGLAPSTSKLPRVTFQKTDDPRDNHQGGRADTHWPDYQIDSWASTDEGAQVLADAVRLAIPFRGTLGTGGNTVTITHSKLEAEIGDELPPTAGQNIGSVSVVHQTWAFSMNTE